MKNLLIVLTLVSLTSCHRYDDEIENLQNQLDAVKEKVNQNTANYNSLKAAFDANMHILSITESDEKYTIVLDDGTIIEVLKSSVYQAPYIGQNGNWFVSGADTGVKATGANGQDGSTPYIGQNNNWWIGNSDTGVSASGAPEDAPYIGQNGNWYVNSSDTGIKATGDNGQDGFSPFIGQNGNWWVGTEDTGIPAKGPAGDSPYIGDNNNWWVGNTDTGVSSIGAAGDSPYVGQNGNWWVGNTDTGVQAQGDAAPKIVDIKQNDIDKTIEFIFDSGEVLTIPFDYSNIQPLTWSKKYLAGTPSRSILLPNGNTVISVVNPNYLMCIDQKGEVLWRLDIGTDILIEPGTYLAGAINSFSVDNGKLYSLMQEVIDDGAVPNNKRYYALSLDFDGTVLNKFLLLEANQNDEQMSSMIVHNGEYYSTVSHKFTNSFGFVVGTSVLRKYDASGNEVWTTTSGALSQEHLNSFVITENNELIAGGWYKVINRNQSQKYYSYAYLAKYNLAGALIAENRIGGNELDPSETGGFSGLSAKSNGKYYAIGGTEQGISEVLDNLSYIMVYKGQTDSTPAWEFTEDYFYFKNTPGTPVSVFSIDNILVGSAFNYTVSGGNFSIINGISPNRLQLIGRDDDNRIWILQTDKYLNY